MAMTAASPSRFHLELHDGHFYDVDGNVVILRGVNLGGSTKLPYTNDTISFVNRPFPLNEADEHFSRLQRWGFNCIRFLVTWEAIEHKGPGIYDTEYLEYLGNVLMIARKYEMYVYIDPHQDAWSRWTGGDGAPLWTLIDIGLNPDNFDSTKAALCQDTYGGKPEDFPKMIWPTNFFKFACATMTTLFWAGNKIAPGILMHGKPVQDVLQSHYINAMVQIANVVRDMDHVIGFGTMNEPVAGYIGVHDLKKHFTPTQLKLGYTPTPYQGMCLANGIDKKIEIWSTGLNQYIFGRFDRKEKIQLNGKRAWRDGVACIWERLGVYDAGKKKPRLLKRNYFSELDFGTDCYVPFAKRYINAIRAICPFSILFIEMPPLEFTSSPFPIIDIERSVNATHWYDGVTLFLRTWIPWFTLNMHTRMPVFGRNRVVACHIKALGAIKATSMEKMKNAPTLIGECGIPFNLKDGEAYRTGDFSSQVEAMNNTIRALEANLLSYTLWCYTSDNTNRYGDLWNMEDFSLFSRDQEKGMEDRDAGGRAKEGYVRPGPWKINGIPIVSNFNLETIHYTLEYKTNSNTIQSQTILFIPRTVHYKDGVYVSISDGEFHLEHFDGYDLLYYSHNLKCHTHSILIKPMIEV